MAEAFYTLPKALFLSSCKNAPLRRTVQLFIFSVCFNDPLDNLLFQRQKTTSCVCETLMPQNMAVFLLKCVRSI